MTLNSKHSWRNSQRFKRDWSSLTKLTTQPQPSSDSWPSDELSSHQIVRALWVRECLEGVGFNVDVWAILLNFRVHRTKRVQNAFAYLIDNILYMKQNLSLIDEILTIAHEDYHARWDRYRLLNNRLPMPNDHSERMAERYASVVLIPLMEEYGTPDNFMADDSIPEHIKRLRIEVYLNLGF